MINFLTPTDFPKVFGMRDWEPLNTEKSTPSEEASSVSSSAWQHPLDLTARMELRLQPIVCIEVRWSSLCSRRSICKRVASGVYLCKRSDSPAFPGV